MRLTAPEDFGGTDGPRNPPAGVWPCGLGGLFGLEKTGLGLNAAAWGCSCVVPDTCCGCLMDNAANL